MKHGELADVDYRTLFDAVNDAIFLIDIETHRYIDVNQKLCEMFGRTREEVRRMPVGSMSAGFKPFTGVEMLALMEKAAEEGPQLFEWLARHKDGRLFWVEVNIKRTFFGGKMYLVAIARDISDRKKTQEDLERRTEFGKLITTISTRFINLPADRIDEWANFALLQIGQFSHVDRGYIFQLHDGGTLMDNTHEWCAEGIKSYIHDLKNLSVQEYSWLMDQLRSGNICHVCRVADLPPQAKVEKAEFEREQIRSLICVPMMLRGELVGFVGLDSVRQEKMWNEYDIAPMRVLGEIFANAMDRKRTEEALRESETRYRLLSENLEEAVRQKVAQLKQAQNLAAIGQMVSVVAHEVRNPLQRIRLGMDILNSELGENEDKIEILEGIDHGVTLLNRIVTELLDYAKPLELEYGPYRQKEIVQEALKTLSHRLDNIDLTVELDHGEREILVDGPKMTDVLVNLLNNAIEAMPRGGSLKITSRFFEQEDKSFLWLSVIDSGCGIPKEKLEEVQEPFVTTKAVGTGLGLPICRKIIEAHRGSMRITSTPGIGTTVEIEIPIPSPALSDGQS